MGHMPMHRLLVVGFVLITSLPVFTQSEDDFVPVTDAMLTEPDPEDWLMWRRTLDSWGYSPFNQIDCKNVGALRMVWSRALATGSQQGTPLVYDGIMYMPNPRDVIQAIDATTGDLLWEYRRARPDDLEDFIFAALAEAKRNIAIYDNLIINTTSDDYVIALNAVTGQLVWETQILDSRKYPAHQTSGPIIANGKVISGRGCLPKGGPTACVITAHNAKTGEELWHRPLIPGPGEPGDDTWGRVPFENRTHVGAWMVPSYDPALNLAYVGTSVSPPAPKFLLGGVDNPHLYHNSTLALNGARQVRSSGRTSNAPERPRSWPLAEDLSLAATETAASGHWTTRRAQFCGRSTSVHPSSGFRSATPLTGDSTWLPVPVRR